MALPIRHAQRERRTHAVLAAGHDDVRVAWLHNKLLDAVVVVSAPHALSETACHP